MSDLHLGPSFQEPDDVTLLGLVSWSSIFGRSFCSLMTVICWLRRLALLLGRLVLELAVVHDLAHQAAGRPARLLPKSGRPRRPGEAHLQHARCHLLQVGSDKTDLRYMDALVDAGLGADGASAIKSFHGDRRGLLSRAAGGDAHSAQEPGTDVHRAPIPTGPPTSVGPSPCTLMRATWLGWEPDRTTSVTESPCRDGGSGTPLATPARTGAVVLWEVSSHDLKLPIRHQDTPEGDAVGAGRRTLQTVD